MPVPIHPTKKKSYKSGAVIAKLLSTEGFTEHLANMIDVYWRHAAGFTPGQRKQYVELQQEFGEIMSELSVGDRMVVGKFIGYQAKSKFDTGLKIGLGAFASRNAQEIDAELPTPDPSRHGKPRRRDNATKETDDVE